MERKLKKIGERVTEKDVKKLNLKKLSK
jgi:hypothetical protein